MGGLSLANMVRGTNGSFPANPITPKTEGKKEMIKPNEAIVVAHYSAESEEDIFDKGLTGRVGSWWCNSDCPADGRYYSVESALKAVCEANCFDYKKSDWENDPCDEGEVGRFDADFLVDVENRQVSPDETEKIEAWKRGEVRLWNCHVAVYLEVSAENRPLELDEIGTFGKEG